MLRVVDAVALVVCLLVSWPAAARSAGTAEETGWSAALGLGYKVPAPFGVGGFVRAGHTFSFPVYTGAYFSGHLGPRGEPPGSRDQSVAIGAIELGYEILLGPARVRPALRAGVLRARTEFGSSHAFVSPLVAADLCVLVGPGSWFLGFDLDADWATRFDNQGDEATLYGGIGGYLLGGLQF